MAKKILMLGWHPSVTDYSKWPGMTAEILGAALHEGEAKLRDLGHEAEWGLLHSADEAVAHVSKLLEDKKYDVVLIGGGVRVDNDHLLLFEELVNVIHDRAPQASICFNTTLNDIDAAVKRWV